MMFGSYALSLYCDRHAPGDGVHQDNEFPHIFHHEHGSTARRHARRAGWLLGRKEQLCPRCSGKQQPSRMEQLTLPETS